VDAAPEAEVGGCVDEDADVVERAESVVVKGEDAFDDDDGGGRDPLEGAGDAGVGGEVVDGPLDGAADGEGADVLDDELGFERIGMIEVTLVAFVEREPGEIAVVEVEREQRSGEFAGKFAGKCGLAGAATTSDGEDEWVCGRVGFGCHALVSD
jgi:hypothetical protein